MKKIFESNPLGLFEKEGWTNYAEAGSRFWEVYKDENSLGQSLEIGFFRSGDTASISWLISPKIDLQSLNNPRVAFRTSTSFADDSSLEALVSSYWDGQIQTIKSATWLPLLARIATEDDDTQIFVDSGDLNLNFYGNALYFAFKYVGSGKTAQDGTFELDDFRTFEKIPKIYITMSYIINASIFSTYCERKVNNRCIRSHFSIRT